MNDLETKMEIASIKMYAWSEGFNAGYMHALNQQKQDEKKPKKPWALLIFRHYCKRWYRGERCG